jgi:hypothetical protein
MRWLLLVLALAVFTPSRADAVTLDEVVALSKSGVSEQVILALIERDQTLYTMTPAQLMKLQREGLSDTILLALLKSGRPNEAPVPASPAPSALPAAEPPSPEVVVVGHSPELPNTQGADVTTSRDYPPVSVPIFVAVPVPYPVPRSARHVPRGPGGDLPRGPGGGYLEHTANPLLCVERVSTGMSPFAPALTRVTECPPQMQRSGSNR